MVLQWPIGVASCLLAVAPTMAQDAAVPKRHVIEIRRVGGIDAPEHAAFADEPVLVVDRKGIVYARVARDGVVRVFDSTGSYQGAIGRSGRGPGEFVRAAAHGFLGDTLWIRNWPLPFISMFRGGQHVQTWQSRIDVGSGLALPAGVTALLDGGRSVFVPDDVPSGATGRIRLPVLLGNRDLSVADTVAYVNRPESMFVPGVGTFRLAPVPLPPLIAVAGDGSGIVVADWTRETPGRIDLSRVNARGQTVWRHTLSLATPTLPRRVRDSLVARGVEMARAPVEAARRAGRISAVVSVKELVEAGLYLPDRLPPIAGLFVGLDGRIWLKRMSLTGPSTWLAIGPAGAIEYEITLPEGATLHQATGDLLWATQLSDDHVPFVVWLRVVAPGPGKPLLGNGLSANSEAR